jgi:hypothetical protein
VLISIPVFHHQFLKGELWKWYKNDLAPPLFAAAILCSLAKLFQIHVLPEINILYFAILMLSALLIYFILIPELREFTGKLKLKRTL